MFGKTDSNLHPVKFSVKIHHDTEEIVNSVEDSFDNLASVRVGRIEEKFVNLTNPADSTVKNVDLNLEKDQQSIIFKNSEPTAHENETGQIERSIVKKVWKTAMTTEQQMILMKKLVNLNLGTEDIEKHYNIF